PPAHEGVRDRDAAGGRGLAAEDPSAALRRPGNHVGWARPTVASPTTLHIRDRSAPRAPAGPRDGGPCPPSRDSSRFVNAPAPSGHYPGGRGRSANRGGPSDG